MILGIISDTHEDKDRATPYIIDEFRKRGVEVIIHCGDIELKDVNSMLYDNFPVFCAITEEQVKDYGPSCPVKKPYNWIFTYPSESGEKRIKNLGPCYAYVGHKRSFDFLLNSQHKLWETLSNIRKNFHNVRVFCSGHTHHQILLRSRLSDFINPGAVMEAFGAAGGNEFATLDTETEEIVFSRIQNPKPIKKTIRVAVISDTLDVTEMDPIFWPNLAERLKKGGVTHIIHCGNINTADIGTDVLSEFKVYYNLRPDQDDRKDKPENWILIPRDDPVREIDGYKFCVQLAMGPELFNKSESEMHEISMKILQKYPEIYFLLCGSTWNSFLEEGEGLMYLNPGNASRNGNYAIIELPRYEITFGRIQPDPLPPLKG
jgi:predicted phosphodiesterase